MKKTIVTLSAIIALLVGSCSKESIEILENSEDLKISIQTDTNIGEYKGVFTTLNSEFRGIVDLEIVDFDNISIAESFHRATITLQNGETVFATSKDELTSNNIFKQVLFASVDIQFNFSVNKDGTNPKISNVIYKNTDADIIVAKHTNRAPITPVSGTYNVIKSNGHPGFGGTQTFNILMTTPDGDSQTTSQVVFNGNTYFGTGVQSNCNVNGTTTICDIKDSGDLIIGGNVVSWFGVHRFNNEDTANGNDCSDIAGLWTQNTTNYEQIWGSFIQDPLTSCSTPTSNTYEQNLSNFNGSGFAPNPTINQLDSDFIIVNGLSDDSTMDYGDTKTTGDFARGQSTGGQTSGGVYAYTIGGNIALGVQPSGSDFTPGFIEIKVTNDTGNYLSNVKVEYDVHYLNDQAKSGSISFSYSTDQINYEELSDLTVISPETADVDPDWVSETKTADLYGDFPNGATIYLRFAGDDVSGGGSRDEYAINNLKITQN